MTYQSQTPPQWRGSSTSCRILKNDQTLYVKAIGGEIAEGQSGSISDVSTLQLTEPTTLTIRLISVDTDLGGSASSKMTLSFVPSSGGDDGNSDDTTDDSNFGLIIIGGITLGGGGIFSI